MHFKCVPSMKKMTSLARLSIVSALLLPMLTACSKPQVYYPYTAPGQKQIVQQDVADLADFPQNLMFFAKQVGADKVLLTPQQSEKQYARFRSLFLSPWEATRPNKSNRKFCWAELDRNASSRGYNENMRPWDDASWRDMQVNAAREAFPSMRQEAITVRPTNVRVVPTARPRYIDPDKPGQGFPFDEFQLSSLPIGFPLMAFHKSRDGAWLYIETSLITGWITANDVAFVDKSMQHTWRNAQNAVFLKENIALQGNNGDKLPQASIGTVLPMRSGASSSHVTVLVPVRSAQGWASAVEVTVPSDTAAPMPLTLTPRQMATLGNRMMGQAYGWGGLFGNRDCSGLTRDLFTCFGVWLPRNSGAQAKTGQVVSLERGLPKESVIREQGVPFLSLLWLPGHIGLYVGDFHGEPAFFHNIWGLRTEGNGRHVIGRAVVTSTKPGKERSEVVQDQLLLNRMKSLNMPGQYE